MAVRRSSLSTPGSDPSMIEKAAGSDADEVIMDLEDAVAPDEKEGARGTIVDAVREHDWTETLVSFRMNGPRTPYAYGDVIEIVEPVGDRIDTIVVPMVTEPADVTFVDRLLSQVEAGASIEDPVGLQLLVEDARAIENADAIAAASDRTETLVFGAGDYSASMGVGHPTVSPDDDGSDGSGDPGAVAWHHARSAVANAARANGLDPIDSAYGDFSDDEGYRAEARGAKALGYVGKWAIHPTQIPIANAVYAPTEAEVEHARAVLDALSAGEAAGAGAVNFDGALLDAAHRRHATRTLERARQAGMVD